MKNPQLQKQLFNKLEGSRWSERYFSAYCPFDTHQKPALLCYDDGWVCLSCGTSGSLKYLQDFLSRGTIRVSRKSSLKPVLPRWRKWQQRYGDIHEIAENAHRIAKEYNMRDYFKQRQIDQFFDVGMFGRLDGWLTFPVFDQEHDIVDIVVRAGKGKPDEGAKYVIAPQDENNERPLYVPNWERVLMSDVLYVVFGVITAWSLEAVELPVVTGITGKAFNAELLQDFHKTIIVIPDYDEEEAGAKLVNELGLRGRLKLVDYPDTMSDLDDVRVKLGNKTLLELIEA